jgi:hypothetical protein
MFNMFIHYDIEIEIKKTYKCLICLFTQITEFSFS